MAHTTLNQTDGQNCTVTGGLTFAGTSNTSAACRAFDAQFTGKFVFEATHNGSLASTNDFVGLCTAGACMGPPPTALQTAADFSTAANCGIAIFKLGTVDINGSSGFAAGPSFNTGTTVMVCVDIDNKKVWAIQGGTVYPSGGNPATNTGGWDISVLGICGLYPCVGLTSTTTNGSNIVCNFGDSAFTNTVPSGFTAGWPLNLTVTQFDGAAVGWTEFTVSGSSTNFNISTSGKNRIIGFLLYHEKGSNAAASTVSTVTDTSGLTWNKRKQFGYNDGNGGDIELWWASAASQLTNDTVTVTLTGATDHGVIFRFGLTLLNSNTGNYGNLFGAGLSGGGGLLPGNPFDANASLTATAHGAGTTPSLTGVSTTLPSLVLVLQGDPVASIGTNDSTNGFGPLGGFNSHTGGIDWADCCVQAKSATLTTQTINGGTITSSDWGMLADAFSSSQVPSFGKSQAVMIG